MPAEKAQAQGFNELLIGLASAAGSIGSGFIFAALGYALVSIIGVLLSILPMLLTIRWVMSKSRLGLAN
jgi:predicted MFS family arabinose efflux permease